MLAPLGPIDAFAVTDLQGCTNLALWLNVTPWTCLINPAYLLLTLSRI